MKLIEDLGTRLINGEWIRYAIFLCPECLQEVEKRLGNGKINKSCGSSECKENITSYKHGETNTKLYAVWRNMKQRCSNPNATQYEDYGGRGITICPEWTNDYITFRDWALNNGYAENLEINRINNDGNYEPSNCDFKTLKENTRHRRNQKVKNIEMANEIRELEKTGNYAQKELAEKYNVSIGMINHIINNKYWKN